VIDRWNEHLDSTLATLLQKYPGLNVEDIPDECLVIDDEGLHWIQVTVRGRIIKMPIKKSDWEFEKS
jgi:hypothetical protein